MCRVCPKLYILNPNVASVAFMFSGMVPQTLNPVDDGVCYRARPQGVVQLIVSEVLSGFRVAGWL